MLQIVERECETLKMSMWELHREGDVRRINMAQGSRLHTGDCVIAWVSWEVTIDVTIHDDMLI